MKEINAPTSAPAWNAEVMLLETSFELAGVTPKSALNPAREMVVPMKAES
jgi:hypothetical protein